VRGSNGLVPNVWAWSGTSEESDNQAHTVIQQFRTLKLVPAAADAGRPLCGSFGLVGHPPPFASEHRVQIAKFGGARLALLFALERLRAHFLGRHGKHR
jgi:hypothetical protein